MTIRNMTIDDYDAVLQIWKGTDGIGLRALDDSRDGIEKFLRRNPSTCFVAENNLKIYGVILCGHDGRRGYIYHAAVHKDHHSKGYGRALVNAALSALKQEGINKVALVTFKSNGGGNAFWETLGFTARKDLIYRDLSLNEKNT